MKMILRLALLWFCACTAGAADESEPEPLFPEGFADQYVEMRDCRHSHEHELRFIRVFASPSAQEPYAKLSADVPYPEGALLLKVEYDDFPCEDDAVLGYTVMQKLAPGTSADGRDWRWQKLDADRALLEDGAPFRCINCHEQHCAPPYGFDLSCAEEL